MDVHLSVVQTGKILKIELNFKIISLILFKKIKRYFFKNSGLQNQSVLYKLESLESEPVEFLDPNKFAEDGTTSLQQYDFSEDGKIYCFFFSNYFFFDGYNGKRQNIWLHDL
jgi:hypothetical protein